MCLYDSDYNFGQSDRHTGEREGLEWGYLGGGGPLVMKLDSSLPHTHTYTYAHVGIGQLKGSKGTEHCDYDRLAMKN